MNKLFDIPENEKNRILFLHEDATKNLYILEQSNEEDLTAKEIAIKLAQKGGWGFNYIPTIKEQIYKIRSLNIFDKVNSLINRYNTEFKSIEDLLKKRLKKKNTDLIKDFKRHLGQFGINLTYQEDVDAITAKRILKPETIKIDLKKAKNLSQSKSTFTQYFPCVVNHKGATTGQTEQGVLFYTMDGNKYYHNGEKVDSKGIKSKYDCNSPEFKEKSTYGTQVSTPQTVATQKPRYKQPSDVQLDTILNYNL